MTVPRKRRPNFPPCLGPCFRRITPPPAIIASAGRNAGFAWEEFFQGEIANAHTRKNYIHAVRKFLAWCEGTELELLDITPGAVGEYFQELDWPSPPRSSTWRRLRKFFDRLVNRHAVVINPAATVRAERYSMVEGKTPEIQRKQAETLIRSIDTTYVDNPKSGRISSACATRRSSPSSPTPPPASAPSPS